MDKSSEKEIINKIKNGEIEYYEFLVKKYSRIIYSYVVLKVSHTMDAEDIVQNSFIKAYKAIERFDTEKSFYPFLFSIVKNEIADFYRKRKENLRLDENLEIPQSTPHESSDIGDMLKSLKAEHQKVLKLLLEGYTYKEIGQKIKRPINTVKTIIRRAKIEFKKIW